MLRKAIADQVSDLFINSLNPINSMLAFAERGKKQVRFENFLHCNGENTSVQWRRLNSKYEKSVFLRQVLFLGQMDKTSRHDRGLTQSLLLNNSPPPNLLIVWDIDKSQGCALRWEKG